MVHNFLMPPEKKLLYRCNNLVHQFQEGEIIESGQVVIGLSVPGIPRMVAKNTEYSLVGNGRDWPETDRISNHISLLDPSLTFAHKRSFKGESLIRN